MKKYFVLLSLAVAAAQLGLAASANVSLSFPEQKIELPSLSARAAGGSFSVPFSAKSPDLVRNEISQGAPFTFPKFAYKARIIVPPPDPNSKMVHAPDTSVDYKLRFVNPEPNLPFDSARK